MSKGQSANSVCSYYILIMDKLNSYILFCNHHHHDYLNWDSGNDISPPFSIITKWASAKFQHHPHHHHHWLHQSSSRSSPSSSWGRSYVWSSDLRSRGRNATSGSPESSPCTEARSLLTSKYQIDCSGFLQCQSSLTTMDNLTSWLVALVDNPFGWEKKTTNLMGDIMGGPQSTAIRIAFNLMNYWD